MNLLDLCPPRMFTHLLSAFDVVLPMQNDTQVHNGIRYSWFTFPWPSKTRTCTIHFFQSFKCTGSTFLPRARFSKKTSKCVGSVYRSSHGSYADMKKTPEIFSLTVSPWRCRRGVLAPSNSWKLGEGNSGWLCWSEWLFSYFWAN